MVDHIRAFYQPGSIDEALRLLNQRKSKACVLAGGTDLALRAGRSVTALVDISRLGLAYVQRDRRELRVGATTTMSELMASPVIQRLANGILAEAAASCGAVQTRNVATMGGNLANASPAADTAVPLLVLDAKVVLQGERSRRRVPLAEFFAGPHKTVANGMLLTEVVIPIVKANTAFAFQRLARTETDIAIVSVAAGVQLDRKGICTWARVALGAVAPQPMRALRAEAALAGKPLQQRVIDSAASAVTEEITPITDWRASAEYRREITRVLVRRALQQCAERLERAL